MKVCVCDSMAVGCNGGVSGERKKPEYTLWHPKFSDNIFLQILP